MTAMQSLLEAWLARATVGLSAEAVARVHAEIGEHYRSSYDAAVAGGILAEDADRAAVSALGDARAANRQYRRVLLTDREARLLSAMDPDSSTLSRRRIAVGKALAGALIIQAFGTWALFVWTNNPWLLFGLPFLTFFLVQQLIAVDTPARGRAYRGAKWAAFIGGACLAAWYGVKPGWAPFAALLLPAYFEHIRMSMRRKLPPARWPRALYFAAALAVTANPSAQSPAAVVAPAFEVATIRPSSASFMQAITDGALVGIQVRGGRVSVGHMSVAILIQEAYGIRRHQLVGPDWLLTPPDPMRPDGLFNIEATIPDGSSADQVPLMLQRLLADRFNLLVRRDSREAETYALVVGTDGPTFRRADPSDETSRPPAIDSSVSATRDPGTSNLGPTRMTILPGGVTRIETDSVEGLVRFLASRGLPFPVVDKTGLDGRFDIRMEVARPSLGGLPGAPGALPDAAGSPPASFTPDALRQRVAEPLFPAVEALGLKLELQKNPIETIIVERVERAPTPD